MTSNDASVADLMTIVNSGPNATCFFCNIAVNASGILSQNAKAYLVMNLGDAYGLLSYAQVKVEIGTSKDAALLVQREIPDDLPNDQMVYLR
jgi:hypothetical protein